MTARQGVLSMFSMFAILLSLLVVTGCATSPEDDMNVYEFNEGMRSLASGLEEGYDAAAPATFGNDVGRKRLAVLRLVNDDGTAGPIGREVANSLQVQLFDPARFSLLERERVDSLLSEFSFGETGLVEELTTSELGNLLGAEVVVVGTVRPGAETATISARIVDLESGEILGIGQVVVYTDFIDINDVRESVDRPADDDDGPDEPVLDDTDQPAGDKIAVAARDESPEELFAQFQDAALDDDLEFVLSITDLEAAADHLDLAQLTTDEVEDYLFELLMEPYGEELLSLLALDTEVVGGDFVEDGVYSLDLEIQLDGEIVETYVDFYRIDDEWYMDLVDLLLSLE